MRTQIKTSPEIKPLLDTASDCFHFVTEFFEVISTSATHIYNSALPLTPKSSVVRKLYGRFIHPSPRVVVGLPASWDPRIASVILPTQYPDVTWSPCGRSVAVSTSAGVEIRDSATLEKLSALESPMSLSLSAVVIAYSPNGRLLACACTRPFSFEMAIAIWDIQTGGIVKTIHGGEPGYPRSMIYSSDGRMLSVACGKSPYRWTVWTFDTASGKRGCSNELGSEFDPVFWTEKDSTQFATSNRDGEDLCIDTWKINSTSNGRPTKIQSFRVRHEFHTDNHQIFFSPATLRVAVVSVDSTIIRDARDSKILLEASASRTLGSYAGHFSSDGNFFACTEQQEVEIWKVNPEGYALWAKFPLRFSAAAGGAFAFSPDSGSVVGWGSGVMEVWKVGQLGKPSASEQPSDVWNSHLVGFSTNGTHVAIGRASSGIITVVDLHSGTPELIINSDMEIVDIKMVDDTVVALGGLEVVSWSLTGRPYEEDERGIRLAGLDESLKIVEIPHDYDLDSRVLDPHLLDDQCRRVFFSSADDMLLFDAESGARLWDFRSLTRFRHSRFSPDGRQLWVSFVDDNYYYDDDEADQGEADNGDEGEENEGGENESEKIESEETESEENEGGSKSDIGEGEDMLDTLGDVDEELERGLEIVEDEETGQITLIHLPKDARPPEYPWKSPKGCKIDGLAIQWVLDRDGKRLLWLPPHWRTTNEKTWRWNGDFLVLRKSTLPEPMIVQLPSASELVAS